MRVALLLLAAILAHCCEPNCSDCSSSFCTACSQGYELTTDSQCLQSTLTGCSLYDPAGKCAACQPTFTLTNGTCEKQYSGCLQTLLESCTLCAPGKTLINQSCVGTLNCETTGSACSKCREGFALQGGMCVEEGGSCMMADSETGVCLMCNAGYQLMGYECISEETQPINCYLYNRSGSCLACKTGYVANALQQCVPPPNAICQQFDQHGNCLSCNQYLLIINGSCIDLHCREGAPGNCQKCEPGFSMKNGSVCLLTDPNCLGRSSQSSNRCDTCKLGYFVDINGTCSKLPPNCAAANIISGLCLQCLPAYNVSPQGDCKPLPQINNCQQVNPSTGTCSACNFNYYLSNGLCAKVSSLCSAYDPSSGLCLNCKSGYNNFGGKCVDPNCLQASGDLCSRCAPYFSPDPLSGACRFTDPNCAAPAFLSCTACKPGYYLNPIYCVAFPPFCAQMSSDFSLCLACRNGWSLVAGQCVVPVTNCLLYAYNASLSLCQACAENYQLANSLCVFSPTQTPPSPAPADKNCLLFNGSQCLQCSARYYLSDQLCVPVNPNCKNHSSDGSCTDCYSGYSLLSGNCVVSPPQTASNCKSFVNQLCVACYSGYFLDPATKACAAISALCRTSNESTGKCLSCFSGYSLSNGVCMAASKDPNCIQFNLNGECTACSSRFFMKAALCTPINPLCKTYNTSTGHCLSCYPGYYLNATNCLAGPAPNSDLNCKLRDAAGKCLQCYAGYFLSANSTCMTANPLCKTLDFTNGACLTCYSGFTLQSGNCVVSSSNNSDPNCVKFAATGCSECYTGFYVQSGVCSRINPLCKTYNSSNGLCLSCYPGYSLAKGQCAIPQAYTLSPQDPYCLQRAGAACTQCSSGFFPLNGVCQNVNPLCRTANSGGSCTSCYNGYVIQKGNCVVLQEVSIPFCQTIANNYCQRCIQGYYLQSPLQCAPVSILCVTYDQNTGNCLSCIGGYFLQVGECVFPAMGFDQNCLSYDVAAYCSQCKPGFYLLNYVCSRIDPFCATFDVASSTCTRCGGGKSPTGPACE